MLSNEVREMARKIGQLYNYDRNELAKLAITKLEFVDGKLRITTGRPGVVIGKRGQNVERIAQALGVFITIVEDGDYLLDVMAYDPDRYFRNHPELHEDLQ